jgi:hypothetical protein
MRGALVRLASNDLFGGAAGSIHKTKDDQQAVDKKEHAHNYDGGPYES